MDIKSKALFADIDTSVAGRLAGASVALVLGFFILFGVAFASPMEIHNAAHDVRHTMAFPCH